MAIYTDIDLSFTSHPVTGDIVKKTDAAAIMQSLKTLCLTAEEELLNDPTIGGNIYDTLFEINDGLIQHKVKTRIEDIIKLYETRVDLKEVGVSRMQDNQGLVVTITFYYANQKDPVTDTIQLKRLR